MRYADRDRVLAQLELTEGSTDDADKIAHVERVELGRAAWLDGELGYAFGTAPVATARTVYVTSTSTRLLLPDPYLRSVTTITVDNIAIGIEGTGWRFEHVRPDGIGLTLLRMDGWSWYGKVTITGVWGDAAGGVTVPPEVQDAVTRLTIQEYQREQLGPVDPAGPDGLVSRPRNPYSDPMVVAVVRRYRIPPRRVAV